MQKIWNQWMEQFGPEVIGGAIAEFVPKLVGAVLVVLFFWAVWRVMLRGFRYAISRSEVDATLQAFIETVARYVIVVVALLAALGQVGVDVTAILTSLGVVGLTVGFAAKDALSNLISGLFILWDRPFVIGDLVEIDGRYGRVDVITLRSTRVVTVDGKMLAIPNTQVVNSTVTSYTNFPHLRLDIEVTVGVNEDLAHIDALFLDEIDGDPDYLDEPGPQMVVKALNDYNVLLEFRVWLGDEKQHVAERFALRRRLFERFTREGVDMPLETIQIAA
jgi:small conductance mechanosensitive channel